MISNYVKKIAITIITVLATTLVPTTVLARELGTSNATSEPKTTYSTGNNQSATQTPENKCLAIDKIAAKVQTQLNERKAALDKKRASIATEASTKQEDRDKELTTKRAEWDKLREENFEKLRAKATTKDQKDAVEEYIKAMKEAISARRTANDAAFATYRAELIALKTSLKQAVEANISLTSSSIDQAISDAKAACQSGESSPETIKQNLKTALEAARSQAKTSRQSTTNNEQLKAIINKRNDAVKANVQVFEQATKAARQNLKAAITN